MNNSNCEQVKLSIQEALQHPDWDAITVEELDVSPDIIEATVRRFQSLCGLDSASDPALLAAAKHDVLFDGALFLKLREGLGCFVAWFLLDDWGVYSMTEVTGSEAWAVDLCERIRVVESVGTCYWI